MRENYKQCCVIQCCCVFNPFMTPRMRRFFVWFEIHVTA